MEAGLSLDGKPLVKVQVNKWEKFLAGDVCCRCCSWCLWFFMAFLFAGLLGAVGPAFSDDQGQDVLSDLDVKNYYAYQSIVGKTVGGTTSLPGFCSSALTGGGGGVDCGLGGTGAFSATVVEREREGSQGFVMVLYEAEGGETNLLKPEVLQKIAAVEKKIRTLDGFGEWCQLTYPSEANAGTGGVGKPICVPSMSLMGHLTHKGTDATAKTVFWHKNLTSEGFGTMPAARAEAIGCYDAGPCCEDPKVYSDCSAALVGMNKTWPEDAQEICAGPLSDQCPNGACDAACICLRSPGASCAWSASPMACSSRTCCTTRAWAWEEHGEDTIIDKDAMDDLFKRLCDPTNAGMDATRKSFLPTNFDCEAAKVGDYKSKFLRFWFTFGAPLTKYNFTSSIEDEDEQETKLREEFVTKGWWDDFKAAESDAEGADLKYSDGFRMVVFSSATALSQFLDILIHDGALVGGSFLFVLLYMWFTTESLFMSSCGMFEIVFSLPIAFFVWCGPMGHEITSLQILVIFLIMGIGADDVFVLLDAWKQSEMVEFDVPKKKEAFTWPQEAVSKIGQKIGVICSDGEHAVVMVPENVVAGQAGEATIYDPKERLLARFAWSYRRAFSAMLVTTLTTCAAFCIGAVSPIKMVNDFCVFAAFVVLFDYLWCITFFASTIMVNERLLNPLWYRCFSGKWGSCCGPGCCWGCMRCFSMKGRCMTQPELNKWGMPAVAEPKLLQQFFGGPLFRFLNKAKFFLVGFWVVTTLGLVVVCMTQLKESSEPDEIGDSGVDMIRAFEIITTEFSLSRKPREVQFVWGLHADDPIVYGADRDSDTPVFGDTARSLFTEESQTKMLALCGMADNVAGITKKRGRCDRTEDCLVRGTEGDCEMEDVAWYHQAAFDTHSVQSGVATFTSPEHGFPTGATLTVEKNVPVPGLTGTLEATGVSGTTFTAPVPGQANGAGTVAQGTVTIGGSTVSVTSYSVAGGVATVVAPEHGLAAGTAGTATFEGLTELRKYVDTATRIDKDTLSIPTPGAVDGTNLGSGVATGFIYFKVTKNVLCETGRYCFMEQAQEYAQSILGKSLPMPEQEMAAMLKSPGYLNWLKCREAMFTSTGREFEVELGQDYTGILWKDQAEPEVAMAWISFNGTFSEPLSREEGEKLYDDWESVRGELAPAQAVQVASPYTFLTLQQELISAAMTGIIGSLIIAFVILLITTCNWRIALLGLLNISCITLCFLGLIPIIGWEIGTNQSIFLIAVVGLSVDYTVHLLHAYNHAGLDKNRQERMQHGLDEMGLSVTSGAITTIGAASFLQACYFTFFQLFGLFIVFVVLFAILMAVTFLAPLCMLIGPEGTQGDIAFLQRYVHGQKTSAKGADVAAQP